MLRAKGGDFKLDSDEISLFLERFIWLQFRFYYNGFDSGQKSRCVGVQAVDDGCLGGGYGGKDREVDGFERYLGVVKKRKHDD